MVLGQQGLLIGAVAAVGVLHTLVPDHWMPITVIARQRGWSRREIARAALLAGTGHVLSTLAIALVVWLAGAALAARFGTVVETASSLALVAFGLWIAIAAWREQHGHHHAHQQAGHGYGHHRHAHGPVASPVAASARTSRAALLLILGSSPMVEGIPAFFAAGSYGAGLIAAMAAVFAISTIATYVAVCVFSTLGLQRLRLRALERHGEVMSGGIIALVGLAFWLWPVA